MKTIKLLNIALQGFRSFKRDVVFPFPSGVGLFHLDGANGAGKSSIWAALTWLLYGKTDRGLKAGDISNWDEDNLTSVVGEFEIGGKLCALTRTWKPNSLNIEWGDGEPGSITQEGVDELIGLDYEGFLNTVLVSQFGLTFFDLEATDRLRVFGEALDLAFWEEKGDLARERARGVSTTLDKAKGALELKRGRLQTLGESKRRLRRMVAEHDRLREEAITRLRREIADEKMRLSILVETHRRQCVKMGALVAEGEEWTRLEVKAERVVRAVEQLHNQTENNVTNTQREIQRLTKEVDDLRNMTGGRCPTCRQTIKTGHTHRAVEEVTRLIEWEKGERHRFVAKLTELVEQLDTVKAKRRTYMKAVDDVGTKQTKMTGKLAESDAELKSSRDKLARLREDLEGLINEASPLVEEYHRVKEEHEGLKVEMAEDKGDVEELEQRLAGLEQWAGLFKELRLWLIEKALAELEVEVNNVLIQLGLEGWAVTFEVERENKTGGVTKGFHVLISTADANGKPIKWKAWSGGETQRLRIAGVCGLAAVIRARRGIKIPLEVWDEPTAGIEDEGIQDLLEFLQARAKEEQRQIWLIDHRSLTFGFDGHVSITKDEMGSHIRVRKGDV